MRVPGYRDTPPRPWDAAADVDPAEAAEFLTRCYAENPRLGPVAPRLALVAAQVEATGTYTHTPDELTYGARLAWRNSSRCIGRLYWRSLIVLDRRRASAADDIFSLLVEHLRIAGGQVPVREPGRRRTGGDAVKQGHIRPVISVFAPAVPGRPYARLYNEQLIRYAGHRTPEGVAGDPRYIEFTARMQEYGWQSTGKPFEVLPLAVETPAEGVRLFTLPPDAVLEVPIRHPEYEWFDELHLRWHAVPAIANMRLAVGGVHYPLAPFSGWYMGSEIGARNFADLDRYDLLPEVARRLGLDTSRESTLWRDRALVELNRAVLWSFESAGVRIADHHTESDRFLKHVANEERAGRGTPADWTWIVPPISGGATSVFHRYYEEADQRPNFYLDAEARHLGKYGEPPAAGTATAPRPRAARCPVSAHLPDPVP
ncbi:nitric oxide synthase oxygenase [Pilimelia anulata]|uniref:Nitric oxide synthase oxygenase n=1 Tax=Pilimelia anulata TaxID=53371 RepID=A0A8J3F7Y2_9ACTN|nr:nitric oxide synthase oxygenase [Pilimelia anulata]GGJ83323.1 nitric oxide synthase oxygenase [Pilimelia anulata]